MEFSISLYDIIGRQLANGFEPNFKPVPTDNIYSEKGIPRVTEGIIAGSPYYANKEGVEYYLPIRITYTAGGESKEIDLPYPVLSFQSRKRMVETPLTERTSTVKEFINIEGYEIRIRGYMVGVNGEFPEAELIALNELYNVNAAVEISNVLTDILLMRPNSKDDVVITTFIKPEVRGIKHVAEYELTLVSDAPFSLIYKKPQ